MVEPHLEPMLATTTRVPLQGDGWAVEPKLDGRRAMIDLRDGLVVRTGAGRRTGCEPLGGRRLLEP